jgi:hypothetical protein
MYFALEYTHFTSAFIHVFATVIGLSYSVNGIKIYSNEQVIRDFQDADQSKHIQPN